ncbi:MAG: hypothetical protein AAGC65_04660 [Mucilaginibacter sp.]|uniref:hypothetical protein n=1 Tax=Mucilaginibacter sp. TaxID=1882438 RepID=UPI0031B14134
MIVFFIFSLLLFIGMVVLVIYLIYRFFKWIGHKKTGIFIIAAIITALFYEVYVAIFPTDSFYYDEYKSVVLKDPPPSTRVIKKQASYPDFHGKYISVALIKLSADDYQMLLSDVKKDPYLKPGNLIGSEELTDVAGDLKQTDIKLYLTREQKPNDRRNLSIGFLNDERSVIIYVVKV